MAVVAVVATVRADEEDAVEKRLGDATSFGAVDGGAFTLGAVGGGLARNRDHGWSLSLNFEVPE